MKVYWEKREERREKREERREKKGRRGGENFTELLDTHQAKDKSHEV